MSTHKKFLLILIYLMSISIWGCADEYEQHVKEISDEVTKGCITFEEKIEALRHYLHKPPKGDVKTNGQHVVPADIWRMRMENGYLDVLEWLDSGWGAWCDQLSDFFMQLARKQDISTRMVFLYANEPRTEEHTIAEALAPDGRWIIVDPLYDLELINNEGKMASRSNLAENPSILRDNSTIRRFTKENPTVWDDENYLSMYYNNRARIIKVLP